MQIEEDANVAIHVLRCSSGDRAAAPSRPAHGGQASRRRDPNEKICQVITPTGSRLGGQENLRDPRRVGRDKKRQDREATEKAQTQLCVINPVTGRC